MSQERLIRLPEVIQRVGLQKTVIYDWIKEERFPKPIKLGSASVWPESEVQAWIDRTIQEARAGQGGGDAKQ